MNAAGRFNRFNKSLVAGSKTYVEVAKEGINDLKAIGDIHGSEGLIIV